MTLEIRGLTTGKISGSNAGWPVWKEIAGGVVLTTITDVIRFVSFPGLASLFMV